MALKRPDGAIDFHALFDFVAEEDVALLRALADESFESFRLLTQVGATRHLSSWPSHRAVTHISVPIQHIHIHHIYHIYHIHHRIPLHHMPLLRRSLVSLASLVGLRT
jgi:hypothetical protein